MPQAAAHIIIPLLIMSFIRDRYFKKSKNDFPVHYAFIAGLAGALPDIDIAIFWILYFLGFSYNEVHRTFAHTLFVPLIFFTLFIIFRKTNPKELGKHKLKLSIIFLMISFGTLSHIILDGILEGFISPLYPLSTLKLGLDLVSYLPKQLAIIAPPTLDGLILILWLIYLELKHKISNFI